MHEVKDMEKLAEYYQLQAEVSGVYQGRLLVLAEINRERDRQDDSHNHWHWLNILYNRYRAVKELCEMGAALSVRSRLIKISAVCVAWVESIDRKGGEL